MPASYPLIHQSPIQRIAGTSQQGHALLHIRSYTSAQIRDYATTQIHTYADKRLTCAQRCIAVDRCSDDVSLRT